ncbi:hypothetical protein KY334_07180 [Candidatus Woesearchaeota archaeon]|nr:hypothetical protein [Candidatus Woesearchaeota archaeon]
MLQEFKIGNGAFRVFLGKVPNNIINEYETSIDIQLNKEYERIKERLKLDVETGLDIEFKKAEDKLHRVRMHIYNKENKRKSRLWKVTNEYKSLKRKIDERNESNGNKEVISFKTKECLLARKNKLNHFINKIHAKNNKYLTYIWYPILIYSDSESNELFSLDIPIDMYLGIKKLNKELSLLLDCEYITKEIQQQIPLFKITRADIVKYIDSINIVNNWKNFVDKKTKKEITFNGENIFYITFINLDFIKKTFLKISENSDLYKRSIDQLIIY